MAIVVTGATGQLGARVVHHLLERGAKARHVVAAGRNRDRLAEVAQHGVKHAVIDYEDPATLQKAFGHGDTVLFVSSSALGDRMQQHRNVVEAAVEARVGRLVYTSVTKADSVDTVLTPEHRATERLIAESGLPHTILRNNLYAEVLVRQVVEASEKNEFVTGWGRGRIAAAARDDYAEGAAAVLLDPSRDAPVYELTGDTAVGGTELALIAETILDKPVSFATRTADQSEGEMALAGVPPEQRAFAIAFDQDISKGAFGDVSGTLAGLLGRPTTPLVDAIRAAMPRDLPTPPTTTATPIHGA